MTSTEGKEFRPIPGYEPYSISIDGVVLGPTGRMVSPWPSGPRRNYLSFSVWRNGKSLSVLVNRAVALAWVDAAPAAGLVAAHLDGNPANNHASNIAWVSVLENVSHKKLHGTELIGIKNHQAKMTDEKVLEMRRLHRQGISGRKLAARFGMSGTATRHILAGRRWVHVSDGGEERQG